MQQNLYMLCGYKWAIRKLRWSF